MSAWVPKWHHCSQLYHLPDDPPGAWGNNNCAESALARYLRESGIPYQGDDPSLIGALRLDITGKVDSFSNPFTWLYQLTDWLNATGLPCPWVDGSTNPAGCLKPWALLLVHALELQPRQYPDAWLAGIPDEPDHFILRLPDGTYNDPLTADFEDCTYSDAVITRALAGGGAYLLPDPARVSWGMGSDGKLYATVAPVVAPTPMPAPQKKAEPAPVKPRFKLTSAQWLQSQPGTNNAVPGAPQVPKGAAIVCIGNPVTVTDAKGAKSRWQKIGWAYKGKLVEGFVLSKFVKAV